MKETVLLLSTFIFTFASLGTSQSGAFISPDTKKIKVAIFVYPGVQIIDFTGPYEVFMQAKASVYSVGEKPGPIKTAGGVGGLTITPAYTFANAPAADVLVLPGGDAALQQIKNPVAMKWIADMAKETPQILTVCSGAFLAAEAHLLDGIKATTFYGMLDDLKKDSPRTDVVWDKKYVDAGKVISTAGLSSGIDGSLYVVSKLLGMGHAQSVALNMEYDWRPDSNYARAMLPDMNIPDELPQSLPKGSDLLSASGDRNHWTVVVRVPREAEAPKIMGTINTAIAKSATWSKVDGTESNASIWNFTDRFGAKWHASLALASDGDSAYKLTLRIDPL